MAKTGSDDAPGTKDKPLATIAKAVDLMRGQGRERFGLARASTSLQQGLVLDAKHGGTAEKPLMIRGAAAGKTIPPGHARSQLSADLGRGSETADFKGSPKACARRRFEESGLPAVGNHAADVSPWAGGGDLRRSADAIRPLAERRLRRVYRNDRRRGLKTRPLGAARGSTDPVPSVFPRIAASIGTSRAACGSTASGATTGATRS